MHFSPKYFSRTISLGLALTGLCVLGSVRPASAQDLKYQLFGVTFGDGAVAFGFFNYNPTTQVFGTYDITTTNGVSDTLIGANYLAGAGSAQNQGDHGFIFANAASVQNVFALIIDQPIVGPGTFALVPGTSFGAAGFSGSGELAPVFVDSRAVATGSLYVTEAPPAVPEASTTVSFGLLLTLGLGGMIVAAKRKKANAEKAGAAV